MANAGNFKGSELERRVSRLEFAEGALVRTRWPLLQHSDQKSNTITDVDVLSLDFDGRLRPKITVTECKSRRGQSGEQDRLIWLVGLQKLVRAERAVLVRDSVTSTGRELARRLDVDLLSSDEIADREIANIDFPGSFAKIGDSVYASREREINQQLKNIGELPSNMISYFRNDAILSDPGRALGQLSVLARTVEKSSPVPHPGGIVLASDAFQAMVLAAIRAAGRIDSLGVSGARQEVEMSFLFGGPGERQMLRILELSDAFVKDQIKRLHHAYMEQGAERVDITVPSLRSEIGEKPEWLGMFHDLAERFRRSPNVARQLPQMIDLVCYDALLGGSEWESRAFNQFFSVNHQQLFLYSLDVFQEAAACLMDYLGEARQLIFKRSVNNFEA